MNDHELIDRLRRTLHDEASQVHERPDAWDRFQRRAPARPGTRRPVFLLAPVAALGLAAAIVAAVVVSSPGSRKTEVRTAAASPASTPATSAGPATTAAAAPTAGSGSAALPTEAPSSRQMFVPLPGGFQPKSVTFVSPSEGFVLGTGAIAHTIDGGATWSALPAPPDTNVSELRFADARDGWAWGRDLWVTHDGGHTWQQLTVPGGQGGVYALEAAAGTVHMVVFDSQAFRVATAPVGSDAFSLSLGAPSVPAGAGPVPTVQLVLQGTTGWMLEVDRTVIGGLRLVNGAWQPWTPPCLGANGPALLAASSPTELVAACDQGVWGPAAPAGERLWASHDGGTTWADAGAVPSPGVLALASPRAGATVVVESGSSDLLVASFDGGGTWSTVFSTAGLQAVDLGFTTASQGVAVFDTPAGSGGQLVTTRDGGHTWQEVRFA